MPSRKVVLFGIAIISLVWLWVFFTCSTLSVISSPNQDTSFTIPTSTPSPSPTVTHTPEPSPTLTPFEIMAQHFEGSPTPEDIETILKGTLELLEIEPSDSAYKDMGNALVTLKVTTGISELDILKCLHHNHEKIKDGEYKSMAVMCAALIKKAQESQE